MRSAFAYVCLAAQLLFFASLVAMLVEVFSLTVIAPDQPEPKVTDVQNQLAAIFDKYRKFFGIGVLGAIAHLIVLKKRAVREQWFLTFSRVFGWTWIPLIPIGTILGILMLGARQSELALQADT